MINSSLLMKLEKLKERYEELASLMSDSEIINNQNKFRDYSKEYARIEPVVQSFSLYQKISSELGQAEAMLKENDEELRELAQAEKDALKPQLETLTEELQLLLIPKDPDDDKNCFLEIRAGTGGDEASIFAGDLFRMYSRYAETQGWRLEIISKHEGEHGGFKEIIARLSGEAVYGKLKFESGAHRVQRVPVTESQGRVHTSACTVAIMPVAEEIEEITINPNDLKIDTYRSSGAGGQHVNKTDSAIRITHLPSGIVIECQDERSQHKNRARAMSLLQAKLLEGERTKQRNEQAETRRNLVGSGDRSERIRTYNFPQGRLTDHRINLTLYKLDQIMEGDIEEILTALSREHQADQLAAMTEQ